MGSSQERKKHVKMIWLMALVLTQPFAMASVSPIPILQTWYVHVVNSLSNNATLFVHCKSKDDDLGAHDLVGLGAEFHWNFKVNFWLTTLFWCYLGKPNADVSFDAFWVERDHTWLEDRCTPKNCFWIAKDDGVYLRNNPRGVDELIHKWDVKLV